MELFILQNVQPRILKLTIDRLIQEQLTIQFDLQYESLFTSQHISFDMSYRPENDEVSYIENFDDVDMISDAILDPDSVNDWDYREHSLSNVKGIFFGKKQEDNTVATILQTFDNRNIISNHSATKIYMSWVVSRHTFELIDNQAISFNKEPTALLLKDTTNNSKLLFRSFHMTSRLFDMDAHYEALADSQITAFFQSPHFSNFSDAWLESVNDKAVIKKVTLIARSRTLETTTPALLIAAAQEFDNVGLSYDENNKIILPEDKASLKRLLRFLDEDYYRSPFSSNRYQSNSKRRI